DWKSDQASNQPCHELLTFCCPSFPKPVIVFPRDAQHPFVTVRDVLAAVHDANCVFTIEFYYLPPTYNLWDSPTERVQTLQSQAAISDVNVGQLITEFLPGSSVWAGISPSPPEPDVWI
ncbi:hypothetical protein K443DRAFT_61972, partial [Laccaria amethystina LaAM-08-1]